MLQVWPQFFVLEVVVASFLPLLLPLTHLMPLMHLLPLPPPVLCF